jgi:hypothetical protein
VGSGGAGPASVQTLALPYRIILPDMLYIGHGALLENCSPILVLRLCIL